MQACIYMTVATSDVTLIPLLKRTLCAHALLKDSCSDCMYQEPTGSPCLANISTVTLSNDISILKYKYISKSWLLLRMALKKFMHAIQINTPHTNAEPIHAFTVGGIHVSWIWNYGIACFK